MNQQMTIQQYYQLVSEVELKVFFPMHLKLHFCVQKLLSTVDLFHKLLQQSIPTNFLSD